MIFVNKMKKISIIMQLATKMIAKNEMLENKKEKNV